MQDDLRAPPLNAVRAFEVAARRGSMKAAGEELGVSPSAVSHQVKQLEESLGAALFVRRNNAVLLTDEGRRFQEAVAPALGAIAGAAAALRRGANEAVLRAPLSIALRWIIPGLERFRRAHPAVRVRLETSHDRQARLGDGVDLAIGFTRKAAPARGAQALMADRALPLAAPALLGRKRRADWSRLPLLAGREGLWDWRAWAEAAPGEPLDPEALRIVDRFDTEDAALQACLAGLGVALAPRFLARRELESGALVPVPGGWEVDLGRYWLLRAAGLRAGAEKLAAWLLKEGDSTT